MKPKYLRYAKSVKLRVQLDSDKPESILRPMLYITYEEYKTNTINTDTTTQLTYYVDYYEDTEATRATLIGLFIAANIVCLIFVCFKVRNHLRYNP